MRRRKFRVALYLLANLAIHFVERRSRKRVASCGVPASALNFALLVGAGYGLLLQAALVSQAN
jgi:hypothetical protein